MVNKEFLKNYTPENSIFTSNNEIELIKLELKLEDKTAEELIQIRNEVVQFYSNEMDKEEFRSVRSFQLIHSMQSVTTVIDHIYYKL